METALDIGVPVIPVYTGDVCSVEGQSLPNSLRALTLRNSICIEDANFDERVDTLIQWIRYHLGASRCDHIPLSLDNYIIRTGAVTDVVGINLVARMHFPEELILSKKEIGRWLRSDKRIFRVAAKIDEAGFEQQIVGYYGVYPLTLATYEKLKTHEMVEKTIRLEDFCSPFGEDTEAIYVLDLARHRGEAVGTALLKDLVRYLANILKMNPKIQKVGTWAFSRAGQKLATRLGMQLAVEYKDYEDDGFFEIENPSVYLSSSGSKLINDILKVGFQEQYEVIQ